jgi:hypothetical protein
MPEESFPEQDKYWLAGAPYARIFNNARRRKDPAVTVPIPPPIEEEPYDIPDFIPHYKNPDSWNHF